MKKLISLLMAMLMVVSVVPFAFAEDTATDPFAQNNLLGFTYKFAANAATANAATGSDFTEMPTVTAYGSGVASGTKEYAADVSETAYEQGTALPALVDGNYFTRSEVVMAATTGTTEAENYAEGVTKNFEPKDNTAKMVKLTEGSGFEFKWTTAQNVARLHLWVYPANVIKEYKVYVSSKLENGTYTWKTEPLKTGSLSYFTPDKNEENSTFNDENSTFNAIVFDDLYSTLVGDSNRKIYGLRFVVTELAEGVDEVYIAEAVPRSTNDIDLISMNPRQETVRTGTTISATSVSQSIYAEDGIMGYNNGTEVRNSNGYFYQIAQPYYKNYPAASDLKLGKLPTARIEECGSYGWKNLGSSSTTTGEIDNKDAFYAVDFGEAKHKINKIMIGGHSSISGIAAFKLMCTNDPETFNKQLSAAENVDTGWTQVARWTEISTKSTRGTFTVADAPEARYWKVVVEMKDDAAYTRILYHASMFSVPEYAVAAATVTEGEATYIDGNTYRLNDDFRLTYKEWRLLVDKTGMAYTYGRTYYQREKFAELKSTVPGILWDFGEEKTVRAVDLWIWPAYAIDTYDLEIYDGGEWKSALKTTGDLAPSDKTSTAADKDNTKDNTNWYSVVLDEAVTTSKLRFTVKSFNTGATNVYVAEANVRENDAVNLIATNSAENDGQDFSIYVNDFKASAVTGGSTSADASAFWRAWPRYSTSNTLTNVKPDEEGNAWYAVTFPGSQHKINRVGLNVAQGTVTSFEIWNSNDAAAFTNAGQDASAEESEDTWAWNKIATITGSYTGNDLVIDIPDSTAATYWKIKITGYEGELQLSVAELYELSASSLSTTGTTGDLEANGYIALDLDTLADSTDGENSADIFYALYNGTALEGVTVEKALALDAAQNYVVYKAPADITDSFKLRTFIWNSSLKPLADDITIE